MVEGWLKSDLKMALVWFKHTFNMADVLFNYEMLIEWLMIVQGCFSDGQTMVCRIFGMVLE